MRIIEQKLGDYATLTGYLHDPFPEMDNIKSFPAILVLPGGAFRACSQREGEPVAMAFFAEGYSAFVLDYTTVTKKPDAVIEDPMRDCNEALTWIRENSDELHLIRGQLAMIGFSGGGHLAASVATHGPNRPDLLLLGYPGILHSDLRALECPDIIECVDKMTPPTFLFSTCDDLTVPPKHPLAFAQALDTNGVDFELHIFRSGVHGLSLGKSLTSAGERDNINPRFAQWFPMAVQWLKEKWGDFLIYGVNDGRNGKYSLDSRLGLLFENPVSAGIVDEYLPFLKDNLNSTPMLKQITLRGYLGWGIGLSADDREEMDRRLLALE